MNIKFRKIKKADIGKIQKFYKNNGMDNAGSITNKFLLDCIDSNLKKYLMFFVAELNKEIIGAVYFVDQGGLITVWSLAVGEKYRGEGVGSGLIKEGIKYLGKKKRNMISTIVDPDNLPSIELFKKQGFIKERKRIRLDKPTN
jgi:ribosomal protein S18 acetylase RimI-like enzyme